jgi:hypothetical protein
MARWQLVAPGLAVCSLLASVGCQRHSSPTSDSANASTHRVTSQRGAAARDSTEPASLSPVTARAIPRDVALACDSVAGILRAALDTNPRREDGEFDDSFRGSRRLGCRLSIRQQDTTRHRSDPPTTLEATFARHGWAQDLRYSADGPDGSDIGMRRLDILCIVMTRSNGDDDADTTSHAPSPDDNAVDTIVECARDAAANSDAGVPDSLWGIASAQGIDSLYAIDVRLQYPPYQDGDFDGDGVADAAVLVTRRATGKLGVAFVLGGPRRVIVVGAGKSVQAGPDDFSWIDQWDVFRREATMHLTIPARPSAPRRGDDLWIAKRDSAGAFIAWNGRDFSWDARSGRRD